MNSGVVDSREILEFIRNIVEDSSIDDESLEICNRTIDLALKRIDEYGLLKTQLKIAEQTIKLNEWIDINDRLPSMEAIKNNTADGQPIEIEANMSPELLAFLKKTDEHFIKQINRRIDTLRKIKHKYRLDSDEVETINLCIKNYKYTLDQHKKGLEKLEDNYKKTLS